MKIHRFLIACLSLIFLSSCGGGNGSETPAPEPKYDASIFVPEGETKGYIGFLFHKDASNAGCLSTIKLDLTNDNGFLAANQLLANEWRYIAYFDDEGNGFDSYEGNSSNTGIRLGDNFITSEGDDPGTDYEIALVDSNLNGIEINEGDFNPYTFEGSTGDLAVFSADFYLETTEEHYCQPSLEMGIMAVPGSSPDDDDEVFIGATDSFDGYTFLYLVSQDWWTSNTENLPDESDLFGINYYGLNIFTSYKSSANITESGLGIRVKPDLITEVNNASSQVEQTMVGSRFTDAIESDSETWFVDDYFTKYLFEGESWSSQRVFLKGDNTTDCYFEETSGYSCQYGALYIHFLSPDKELLFGFSLGGYDGAVETTFTQVYFNNDD